MWISACRRGLSQRVKGPEHVATLLLQVRRGTALLVAIGLFAGSLGWKDLKRDPRDFTSRLPRQGYWITVIFNYE